MAYATHTDLIGAGSSVVIPDDGSDYHVLVVASGRIDEMLIGAVYAVDSSGNPTEADVIAALKAATVAQALWMLQSGDEMASTFGLQESKIGNVQWARAKNQKASRVGVTYAPDAVTILRTAGLLPTTARRWAF